VPLWPEVPPCAEVEPDAPVLPLCDELLVPGLPYVELPLLPVFPAGCVLLEVCPLIEPCAFVSWPVLWLELVPVDAVAVPEVFPCVPAVEPVPWAFPDVLSVDDVFVLLLPLLQPKTNAAASASPYAYFICASSRGFRGALSGAPPHRESPRLLRRGRHRAVGVEATRTPAVLQQTCYKALCSHAVRAAAIHSARRRRDARTVRFAASL
jgi:hypothetical protein